VKRRRVKPGTPGAKKVKRKSTKWYGRVPGSSKPIPLSANKVAAQQMLAALVNKAELGKVGITDPFESHRNRPLSEHLIDWENALRAGGASPKHVRQTVACARRIMEGCQFVLAADFSASRVQRFVADLRKNAKASSTFDPAKEHYTKRELAALLGVKPSAIPSLLRRHRLNAVGNGKARRYPKSTADALRAMRSRGKSIKTSNLYLDSIKHFASWMVRDRRMPENPLTHLSGGNVKLDRRHDRRCLSLDELRSVIQVARQSGRPFRGLAGHDRAILYSVACASGFRAAELASLTPSDFDVSSDPPTVTLAAENAKNGRTAVQPLPPDVAAALRDYLSGRPVSEHVWPGTWHEKAADMLRLDLECANIPYSIDGTDGPLYADFHSLRHAFVAMLDRSGATLKEAMQLARHSDPKLTMAVYGRAQLHDLGAAVNRLPSLLDQGSHDRPALRATGTDGNGAPVCTGFAQTDDTGLPCLRIVESNCDCADENKTGPNSLISQGVEAGCDSLRATDSSSMIALCKTSSTTDGSRSIRRQ
jgi:integrase